MEGIGSPGGALALAVTVLLVVLGHRLARPERAADWAAVVAYAAALALGHAGGRAAGAPPGLLRAAGAAALLAGLLVAGAATRARLRAAPPRTAPAPIGRGDRPLVYAGLGLVVLGQLLRGPSELGAAAAAVATAALAFAAWRARRGRPGARPP